MRYAHLSDENIRKQESLSIEGQPPAWKFQASSNKAVNSEWVAKRPNGGQSENITFRRTTYAGGKNRLPIYKSTCKPNLQNYQKLS